MRTILSGIIVLLALGIGILHFALDFVLFRGNILGSFGPPPGGAPSGAPAMPAWPGVIPLNRLFLASLVLFLLLAILFLAFSRGPAVLRGGIDVLLIAAGAATLIGWNNIRRPNPMGLATWAVAMEIAIVVFAAVHMLTLQRRA